MCKKKKKVAAPVFEQELPVENMPEDVVEKKEAEKPDYFEEYYKAYKNDYIEQYLRAYHHYAETKEKDEVYREFEALCPDEESEE